MNLKVPPPVASAPAQTSAPGTSSKFQELYQNLPSMQDQNLEDGQQADSKNVFPKKKPLSEDNAGAIAVTSGTWNNATLPNAPHALALSLGLPQQSAVPLEELDTVANTPGSAQDVAKGPQPDRARTVSGESGAKLATSSLRSVPPSPASEMSSAAATSAADSNNSSPRMQVPRETTVAPMPASSFNPSPVANGSLANAIPEESSEAPVKSVSESSEAAVSALASGRFPLSVENLAFAMQLAQAAPSPDALTSAANSATPAVAKPTTTASMRPELSTEVAQPPVMPSTGPSAAPLRNLPAIPTTPSGGRDSAHSDSLLHQAQASGNAESSIRDSVNLAKPDTAARGQLSGNSQSAAPAAIPNHSPGAFPQALPDDTAWLGAGGHIDTRPSMNLSDQPGPSPAVTTPPELQPLNLAPPRTNPSSEILLDLGNGQTSAAVRVVDRAGTISVSVHASDQDLRNSLRSNLSDLTTQLNAQGVRTEVLKTVSAQAPPESRQEQGGQQQRGSSQQHSLSQNDRQSQRDRRANNQWLDELAEQAGASTLQPGGKNS